MIANRGLVARAWTKKFVLDLFRDGFPICRVPFGSGIWNRSPKGNMWSAIPVALLCMIVNWSERKQGSGPKGDKVL